MLKTVDLMKVEGYTGRSLEEMVWLGGCPRSTKSAYWCASPWYAFKLLLHR